MQLQDFAPGIDVYVSYVCRDIGYGIEADADEMVFVGNVDAVGKWEFRREDGTSIYLFEDEIAEFLPVQPRPAVGQLWRDDTGYLQVIVAMDDEWIYARHPNAKSGCTQILPAWFDQPGWAFIRDTQASAAAL